VVPDQPTKGQGHLLSCRGTAKNKKQGQMAKGGGHGFDGEIANNYEEQNMAASGGGCKFVTSFDGRR